MRILRSSGLILGSLAALVYFESLNGVESWLCFLVAAAFSFPVAQQLLTQFDRQLKLAFFSIFWILIGFAYAWHADGLTRVDSIESVGHIQGSCGHPLQSAAFGIIGTKNRWLTTVAQDACRARRLAQEVVQPQSNLCTALGKPEHVECFKSIIQELNAREPLTVYGLFMFSKSIDQVVQEDQQGKVLPSLIATIQLATLNLESMDKRTMPTMKSDVATPDEQTNQVAESNYELEYKKHLIDASLDLAGQLIESTKDPRNLRAYPTLDAMTKTLLARLTAQGLKASQEFSTAANPDWAKATLQRFCLIDGNACYQLAANLHRENNWPDASINYQRACQLGVQQACAYVARTPASVAVSPRRSLSGKVTSANKSRKPQSIKAKNRRR